MEQRLEEEENVTDEATTHESNAADTNENLRYPLRERRQPEYFKDYVIGDDESEAISLTIDINSKDLDNPVGN